MKLYFIQRTVSTGFGELSETFLNMAKFHKKQVLHIGENAEIFSLSQKTLLICGKIGNINVYW